MKSPLGCKSLADYIFAYSSKTCGRFLNHWLDEYFGKTNSLLFWSTCSVSSTPQPVWRRRREASSPLWEADSRFYFIRHTHTHTMHTEYCFVRTIMSRRLRDLFASSLFPNYVSLGTSLNYFICFISFKIKIQWIAYYYTKACSLKVGSVSQNCANTRRYSFPFLTCPHEHYLSLRKDIFFQ